MADTIIVAALSLLGTIITVWAANRHTLAELEKKSELSDAKLDAKLTKGEGKLAYTSSNNDVVEVDAQGTLKPVSAGTAEVAITAAATENYRRTTATVVVTVE